MPGSHSAEGSAAPPDALRGVNDELSSRLRRAESGDQSGDSQEPDQHSEAAFNRAVSFAQLFVM